MSDMSTQEQDLPVVCKESGVPGTLLPVMSRAYAVSRRGRCVILSGGSSASRRCSLVIIVAAAAHASIHMLGAVLGGYSASFTFTSDIRPGRCNTAIPYVCTACNWP